MLVACLHKHLHLRNRKITRPLFIHSFLPSLLPSSFQHYVFVIVILAIYLKNNKPNQIKSQQASVDRYLQVITQLTQPLVPTWTQQAYIYPQKPSKINDESHCVVHPMGSCPACGSGASKMSCIVLASLKVEEVCRKCCAPLWGSDLQKGCLCASDLGFVPVFPPEYSTSVACGRWVCTPTGYFPPCVGWYWLAIWLQCTAHRRVAFRWRWCPFRSREENSLLIFFQLNILFFCLMDSSYLAWGREVMVLGECRYRYRYR